MLPIIHLLRLSTMTTKTSPDKAEVMLLLENISLASFIAGV